MWANFAGVSYADVWSHELTIGWGQFAISEDLLHWVNDGLMTVFFFVVGLEIKRELVRGELRDRRTAASRSWRRSAGWWSPRCSTWR